MKVIFLDIDGVLNTSKTFDNMHAEFKKTGILIDEVEEEKIKYLKEIVDQTNAVIVLSSSWRKLCYKENNVVKSKSLKMNRLIEILKNNELTIIDITPCDPEQIRENEINSWLQGKEIENFIVIDDDSSDLLSFIPDELIKTTFKASENELGGLCQEHVKVAVKILNRKRKEE